MVYICSHPTTLMNMMCKKLHIYPCVYVMHIGLFVSTCAWLKPVWVVARIHFYFECRVFICKWQTIFFTVQWYVFHAFFYCILISLSSVLYGNKIKDLPSGVFKGLSSLQLLLLNANEISCIRKDAFRDLHSLSLLSLYDNNIQTLANGTFDAMKSIQTL